MSKVYLSVSWALSYNIGGGTKAWSITFVGYHDDAGTRGYLTLVRNATIIAYEVEY